jgi:translocation protein SEC62
LEDSIRLGQLFVDFKLLLPMERHLHSPNETKKKYPKHLVPARPQFRKCTEKGFYAWTTPKPFRKMAILLFLGVLLTFAFMLFNLWPLWLKIAIWYFSFYTLIILVSLCISLSMVRIDGFHSIATGGLALPVPLRGRLLDLP